jgi:hypothetical protein
LRVATEVLVVTMSHWSMVKNELQI